MSKRLDKERQERLEPQRMEKAIQAIEEKGIHVMKVNKHEIRFIYKDHIVKYFPYSGWHSGKSIKDGRGLNKLLNQIQ